VFQVASIEFIGAREILDSRGNPTVEVEVILDDGSEGRAAVPSGASTGAFEAVELRDGDARYGGKGVSKAVLGVIDQLGPELVGYEASEQRLVDQAMLDLDGTDNKGKIGANAILGVSLAVAHAAAHSADLPLYRYIGGPNAHLLPVPMMNIVNGGAHADSDVDVQEFMIAPIGAPPSGDAVEQGAGVYHALKSVLRKQGLSTGLGDEGGFAPNLPANRAALELISTAVEAAGLRLGTDIALALDVAASSSSRTGSTPGRVARVGGGDDRDLRGLDRRLPDRVDRGPAGRGRLDRLVRLMGRIGDRVQVGGDDLFVTNVSRLQRGIDEKAASALLVKVNQIGSLTETLDAVDLAHRAGFSCMMSHRSGETEDTTIADLAVATNCGQIKSGARPATDRVAKYNQLLRSRRTSTTRPATPALRPSRGSRSDAVPSGPRTPSRPGSGPGRGRPRTRATTRQAPSAPVAGKEPVAVTVAGSVPARRGPSSLTARAIALTVVLLILTISYASSLRIYYTQAQDIAATKVEIAERQQRIVELQGELAKWQDEEYVKTQARQRLGWVVPGETGYKVVDAEGRPLGGGAEISGEVTAVAEPGDAWWAKLWGSVAAADEPAPASAAAPAADKPSPRTPPLADQPVLSGRPASQPSALAGSGSRQARPRSAGRPDRTAYFARPRPWERRKSSTAAAVGRLGLAPGTVTASAAAAMPRRRASGSGSPWLSAAPRAPVKASPAAVVSTASTR
jgi:enolase